MGGHRANRGVQDWGDGPVNAGNDRLPEQSLGSGNLIRNQGQRRQARTVIELLEVQCRQLAELKTPGGPSHGRGRGGGQQYCEMYSRRSARFSQWIPLVLPVGGDEKKPFGNTPELSVLCDKACPQGKLVNHNLTYCPVIRDWLGEGK